MKKWRTLIDLTSKWSYNGIAYVVKRLAQRDLLAGKSLAKPTHQDVDTSWWQTGGSTTSLMDGISRLLIYSQFFPKGAYNMKKCLDENKVAILTGKAIQDDETFKWNVTAVTKLYYSGWAFYVYNFREKSNQFSKNKSCFG